MNKVVVSLCGGLGNQLFQYAMGRALAERSAAELALDLKWFSNVIGSQDTTLRSYALGAFNLPVSIQYDAPTVSQSKSLLARVMRRFFKARFQSQLNIPVLNESGFAYDPSTLLLSSPVWLNGYWQSYRYFEPIANQIREELATPRNMSLGSRDVLDQIKNSDSICIHVRRGDYVSNVHAAATHGVCGVDYYSKGVSLVSKGLSSPHCFVFSDDPDWVRENIRFECPITVVDVNGPDDAHQDLWLMAACKRFVIANSSLSWWGAWLGSSDSKVVIAPKNWFLSGQHDTKDLIPVEWVRL